MMSYVTAAFLIITSFLTALLSGIFGMAGGLVLMGALLLLSITGILKPDEALSGFANTGLMTVAAYMKIGIDHAPFYGQHYVPAAAVATGVTP